MGRPLKQIDEGLVQELARIACTNEEIAAICECSTDTLTRRFAEVIKTGREHAKASLRRKQWGKAMEGNVTMLIWLGKQLLGQADQSRQDITSGGERLGLPGLTNAQMELLAKHGDGPKE